MILNDIKQAICITFDKRIQEFPRIQSEWANFGITVERFLCGDGSLNEKYNYVDTNDLPPIYSDGIQYTTWYKRPNAYNVWKCHQQILNEFVHNHYRGYILLLEDDAEMQTDFGIILNYIEHYLHKYPPHILNFGPYHYKGSYEVINDNLLRLNGSGGLHACLLSVHICKKLLEMLPLGPLDWMCGQFIHPRYTSYGVYPAIVTQKSGWSFVEGGNLEKPDRWQR